MKKLESHIIHFGQKKPYYELVFNQYLLKIMAALIKWKRQKTYFGIHLLDVIRYILMAY